MENTYLENNKVCVIGQVCDELEFSHEVYGEKFYSFKLNIPRLSSTSDIIRIMISERFFSLIRPEVDDIVKITGQYRSYNNFSGNGSRLVLNVFVKEIEYADEFTTENPNSIYLNGYICKPTIYRTTPFSREIADILLAVNRSYNKSDYIPCIAWGRNAKFAQSLSVGTNLKVWGRIQSREYQKKTDGDEFEFKTAYEISICKMEAEGITP